jgi:ribonucleoside-diphosphate reductase alpha chain
VFARLRLPWESAAAADMNQRIFEHLYYAAVYASVDLTSAEGAYETFEGSPMSEGYLQPDLWSIEPLTQKDGTLDWTELRTVAANGVRNSLLVAPMPTASTSQILGYTECFEPMTSNIYARRTLAGEYVVVNRYLMNDLMALGLWTPELKQQIIMRNGSVQGIDVIPEEIQALYKTAWEIKQRTLIDMAAARGAFICQSQSLNLFMENPNYARLTSMHFYGWKLGLKTGCYYLRTKAPVMAQKFTVDPRLLQGTTSTTDVTPGESDSESESEAEAEAEETPEEKKARERREFRERLAKAREASENDEEDGECAVCSA